MSLTETIKTMVKKASLLSAALLLLAGRPCRADTAPGGVPEYRLKAAYIYKILPFVHWPEGSDGKGTLTVGVFGKDAHKAARQLLDGKTIKSKDKKTRHIKVVELSGQAVAEIERIEAAEPLGKCQVVFVSASCRAQSKKILKLIGDRSILTFGETDGFLESGGIINFVAEKKKIRFEVNLDAARRARLKIDSQLLRLAKRVVKKR